MSVISIIKCVCTNVLAGTLGAVRIKISWRLTCTDPVLGRDPKVNNVSNSQTKIQKTLSKFETADAICVVASITPTYNQGRAKPVCYVCGRTQAADIILY